MKPSAASEGKTYCQNLSLLCRSLSALTQILLSAPAPADVTCACSCPRLFYSTPKITYTLTYTSTKIYLTNLQNELYFKRKPAGAIFSLASKIISQFPETQMEKNEESSQFGKEEVDPGDKHFGLLAAVLLTNSAARLGKSRQ